MTLLGSASPRLNLSYQSAMAAADAKPEEPGIVSPLRMFQFSEIPCPVCRVDDARFLGVRGGATHRYGQGIECRIVRCRRCGLIYPNPFPYPTDPQALYGKPDAYFEHHSTERKVEGARELIRGLGRTGRLLDIGSGRGEFLRAAQLEGLEAVGLDLSAAMAAEAKRLYGVEVRVGTVEELEDELFDVIVAAAIIEHVYDPDSFMAQVARLSHSGAALFLDTPNEPSLLTRIGNASERLKGTRVVYNLSPTWPPYHVFGFSPRTLRILLEKHAFVVDRIEIGARPEIPGGGLKAFLGTQLNRLANRTGTAMNMSIWAHKGPSSIG